MNLKKIGPNLLIFLVIILVILVGLLISSNSQNNKLKEDLAHKSAENINMKVERQLEEIEQCRDMTKEIIRMRYEIDEMSQIKNELCNSLTLQPKDVLDPQRYYAVNEFGDVILSDY